MPWCMSTAAWERGLDPLLDIAATTPGAATAADPTEPEATTWWEELVEVEDVSFGEAARDAPCMGSAEPEAACR